MNSKRKITYVEEIYVCEYCGKDHDGKYGSGRFCSSTCASKYSNKFVSENGRKSQIKALNDKENRKKNKKAIKKFCNDIKKKSKKAKEQKVVFKPNTTLGIGRIGELFVAKKFIEHGYEVFLQVVDTNGIDMIVKKSGKDKNDFKTIQVKSSNKDTHDGYATYFKLSNKKQVIQNGKVNSTEKLYSKNLVDYFALYSLSSNDAYLLKNDIKNTGDRKSITIRKHDSDFKCGVQPSVINKAKDYQIDNVIELLDYDIDVNDIIDSEFNEIN